MKKLFLLLVVIPLLGAAQTNLVTWYRSDLQPTLLENHITSAPVSGVVNHENWALDAFYMTNGNYSTSTTLDPAKYIQFTLGSEASYQIKPSSFAFSVRKNGGYDDQKIQVKFSKKADFSEAQTILTERIVTAEYSNYSIPFPPNTIAASGETVFVRIYVYNTNNDLHIQHNQAGNVGPVISGSVILFSPEAPKAFDDKTATLKNASLIIDILANDAYISSGALTKITATKPTHGTVVLNNIKDVSYTPDANYVGYDSFYYTLMNAAGESNTAKVEIQVIDGVENALVRWNNQNMTSKNYTSNVSGGNLNAVQENIEINHNEVMLSGSKAFMLSNLPNPQQFDGKLNPSKYLALSLKASNAGYLAFLKKLKLTYRSRGSGNLTIQCSKTSDFTGKVYTVADDIAYNSQWVVKDFALPAGTFLLPDETLYFRIYTYNTWDSFFLDFIQDGEGGPAITGIASLIHAEPCSTTVTWNGSEWIGGEPTIDKNAVVNADYDTSLRGSFEACTLEITAGNIIIAKENSIVLKNALKINSNASLSVKSDGNFIQKNNDSENSGVITVERAVTLRKLDYVYWSSPVRNQNFKSFSPGTVNNRFYVYNEGTNLFDGINPLVNNFGNSADGNFESAAKGYAIRASNAYPAGNTTTPAPMQVFNAIFSGTPHNGKIVFPLAYKSLNTGSGNNLIGNPYPSNIDFNQLVKNNSDLIEGTAYLWTNINPNPAMQGSNYPNGGYFNNYATLNKIGGIPATKGKSLVASDNPTQIIKIGQAFIVKAKKAGALIFDNTVRTTDTRSVFINKSSTDDSSNNRFWLQLKSPLDVVTTTLIGYTNDAQNGYDKDEDAKLLVVGDDALYSQVEDFKLGIQGRKGPLQADDVVKLGMNHYETGNHTISLGQRDGIFADQQAVYLKDKITGAITNLTLGDYTFVGNAGTNTERFEIIYRQETTLATESNTEESVLIYRDSSDFVVKAKSSISDLEVFDLNGRLMYKVKPQTAVSIIPSHKLVKGVYLIKVMQKDKVTVKRIIK